MPRRLGQHFLRRASVERLLGVIDPRSEERFLEIGSGAGALTLPLAKRAREVVAVELDEHLADQLSRRAPDNVRVVRGDALDVDLLSLVEKGDRAVGNLPYAISSPLLRRLVGLHERVVDLHVMLQAEVADRIAAGPGSKRYGVLSVLFGLWADLDTPLRFGPGCFDPPRGSAQPCCGYASASIPERRSRTRRPSSAWSSGPSPIAAKHLKTTCKIAILTSRNTWG